MRSRERINHVTQSLDALATAHMHAEAVVAEVTEALASFTDTEVAGGVAPPPPSTVAARPHPTKFAVFGPAGLLAVVSPPPARPLATSLRRRRPRSVWGGGDTPGDGIALARDVGDTVHGGRRGSGGSSSSEDDSDKEGSAAAVVRILRVRGVVEPIPPGLGEGAPPRSFGELAAALRVEAPSLSHALALCGAVGRDGPLAAARLGARLAAFLESPRGGGDPRAAEALRAAVARMG